MSVVIGGTTYVYLGELDCGGSLGYDNLSYGRHGVGNQDADVIMYLQTYLEHKQTVTFDGVARVHQPTVGFNNNTEAIIGATGFSSSITSTEEFDYGDAYRYMTRSYTNYGPEGWYVIQFSNTFGSCEWTWSQSDCVYLPDPVGHDPYSIVPKVRTRQGSGGGWSVGQA